MEQIFSRVPLSLGTPENFSSCMNVIMMACNGVKITCFWSPVKEPGSPGISSLRVRCWLFKSGKLHMSLPAGWVLDKCLTRGLLKCI